MQPGFLKEQLLKQDQEAASLTFSEATALKARADEQRDAEDVDAALASYDAALAAFKENGDAGEALSCSNNAGAIVSSLGDQDKAAEYFTDSLQMSEKLGDKKVMAHSHRNLSFCMSLGDGLVEAIEHMEKAMSLFRELGDEGNVEECIQALGSLHSHMAFALSHAGEHEKALQCHNHALGFSKTLDDLSVMCQMMMNVGSCHAEQEQFSEALDQFQKTIVLVEVSGMTQGAEGRATPTVTPEDKFRIMHTARCASATRRSPQHTLTSTATQCR
jgi:tetratricopeptide (TPR) repeat protein